MKGIVEIETVGNQQGEEGDSEEGVIPMLEVQDQREAKIISASPTTRISARLG